MTFTTVGEEKRLNPRVGDGRTEAEFAEIMDNLNLPAPKKIDIAVPANLHCGIVPPSSMSGDPLPERGWAAIERTPEGIPEVTLGWVDENKGAIRMVDVREIEASKSWDKEEPVITICRSGRRSGRVALELEKLGFKRIASMRGGMVAWKSQ
jgi:rhodanese-related sulfurtransferase